METDFQATRSRSLNLINVSGVLVTLVTGLIALSLKTSGFQIPDVATVFIEISIGAFVASVLVSLMIQWPRDVQTPKAISLQSFVETDWNKTGWDREASKVQAKYLVSLQKRQNSNAKLLAISILIQLIAVSSLAIAAICTVHIDH